MCPSNVDLSTNVPLRMYIYMRREGGRRRAWAGGRGGGGGGLGEKAHELIQRSYVSAVMTVSSVELLLASTI